MESIVGTAPVCSLCSELSGVFSGSSAGHRNVYLNRQPSISPENMYLFRISRELKFKVCNHVEPQASLHTAQKGEHYSGEEKEVGRVTVNRVQGFTLVKCFQERRGVFLFPVGLCYHCGI